MWESRSPLRISWILDAPAYVGSHTTGQKKSSQIKKKKKEVEGRGNVWWIDYWIYPYEELAGKDTAETYLGQEWWRVNSTCAHLRCLDPAYVNVFVDYGTYISKGEQS